MSLALRPPEAGLTAPVDEATQLRDLAQAHADSALLQAMRASVLEMDVHRRAREVQLIRQSTAWRITWPLRAPVHLLRRGPALAARLRLMVADAGWRATADRLRCRLLGALRRRHQAAPDPAVQAAYQRRPVQPAPVVVAPRVLIVAELSLPQCAKYRVWQKQAQLARLGTACTVLDWTREQACRSALQTHALVIFYRVPGTPGALRLIAEAKRLGVRSYWEADDLIFDLAQYQANRNLDTLAPGLKREVLAGVGLFRRAMLDCEGTIASTPALAGFMRAAGAGPGVVIENALDAQTLAAADAAIAAARERRRTGVMIAYGSGSLAHDADFAVAAPALAAVLALRPQVRVRLIGPVRVPPVLDRFADRIERLPVTGYAAYLGLLAEADISLAPLEDTAFNDAKSNIKFIEAAILGLPSVCSGRANFLAAVVDGETGLLAEDAADWRAALLLLVDHPVLARRMGEAARLAVLSRYAPARVAAQQVAPLTAGLDQRPAKGLLVLVVNVFFAPSSFGGATIVAEQMARRLHARADTSVHVFTSLAAEAGAAQYMLRRYEWEGIPVTGVQLPHHDTVAEFDNPEMAEVFRDVLAAVQPDVVHFHAVQNLSAALLRECAGAGIPFVVTLHDAWWLCGRQFMVTASGSYCFQTRIDLNICEACLPGALHLRQRFRLTTQALSGAALLLSPSEAHRQLYLANGFAPERVLVNHNGIRMPDRARRRRPGAALRFGYVGGASALKGFHLVRQAFEASGVGGYELVIVDNTLNLGFSSVDVSDWRVAGRIRVVPAYTQDELDDFFDGLDVLLFPSQWKESFGLIVCEALVRDVWVVVTEGGGAAEFVRDGENGSIIPLVNDPRSLQDAVEALLAAPGRLLGHLNAYKGLIGDYGAQATDLHRMLQSAVSPG